jgi:hypothetical protein
VRAIGPSLTEFGLSGVLAEQVLTLFNSSDTQIASSPTYWDYTDIVPGEYATGAFPIDYAAMDTALVITMKPGSYTAELSGMDSSTGVALA